MLKSVADRKVRNASLSCNFTETFVSVTCFPILFCSLTVLDPRVDRITEDFSPKSSYSCCSFSQSQCSPLLDIICPIYLQFSFYPSAMTCTLKFGFSKQVSVLYFIAKGSFFATFRCSAIPFLYLTSKVPSH